MSAPCKLPQHRRDGRPPRAGSAAVALALLLLAPAARAQEDGEAPIPYSDEDKGASRPSSARPKAQRDHADDLRDAAEAEEEQDAPRLAGLDDPNVGLSLEAVAGLMLVGDSRGAGPAGRPAWGLRATWEFGRLSANETLHEALFADITWTYTGQREGTTTLFADDNAHRFSIAPAFAFPLRHGSTLSFFLQAGAGLAYQSSVLHINQAETRVTGVKPLFEYGVGFRVRPTLVPEGSLRLAFRFGLTRYRRGYIDDTFLGGSLGVLF